MAQTGRPALRRVEAVQRAVTVLDALAEDGIDLGTNELARRTGVNASSVSRVLSTLADSDLVQYVHSTGRYRLGTHILHLASAARRNLDGRTVARTHLDDLVALTGETATLSLPGEQDVLTIDFAQSDASVRSVASIGRNSVAHATAVGKVFLAWGGSLPTGELHSYTQRTITDRDRLATEITRVRESGWAIALGEREEELNGLAVPVLDTAHALVAILGVQGPATRFTRTRIEGAAELLRERAPLISAVAAT